MITYREATSKDGEQIAQLHSLSWQQNYRGAFSDEFLDGPVHENRRQVWQNRLSQPSLNQYIIVAETDQEICGFACAYVNNDPVWGTLLDNLHVRKAQRGQGIGSVLVKSAADWAYHKNPEDSFYLWVLVQNTNAQRFYERMGGVNQEKITLGNSDGSVSDCYRYVWSDVTNLL